MLNEFLKEWAKGEKNFINQNYIATNLGLKGTIDVRQIKYDEVTKEGALIGSCKKGNYFITTEEELKKTIKKYQSQIGKMSKFVKALKRNFQKEYGKQLEL